MKETVTSPPSNTRHPKENSGVGKQFFPRGQEDSFFKATGIQAKLSVGQRGDKYEQQADAMAGKLVSKKANNNPVTQTKAVVRDSEDKIDKKEEEQKQEEGNTLQRKPMFESDGEPDVQRSMYPENDEGERVFRSENDALTGNMSKGETIVSIARSKLGKVKAKEGLPGDGGKQLRFGHETLLEIFQLAAPGVWEDDVIKYVTPGLPSWCGIFAVYCIKKAGIDIGTWQMGKGVSAFGKLKQTESPQAGDIGYMDANQHHAIIVKVEGDMVHSIDGNSGLQSEIIENKRPIKAYRGFFTASHNASTGDVQKKENPGSSNEASPSIENKINASKGSGNPLDNSTRSEMESGFGNDFSGVRVHTGNEAQQMNKDLNAQAFTHGQDIYFDEGKYNPETTSGKHLLAHELTHTVQQTGSVQKMIQKNGNPPAADPKSKIDFDANVIYIDKLYLPKLKSRNKNAVGASATRSKNYKREESYVASATSSDKAQDEVWKSHVEPKVKPEVEKLATKAADKKAFDASVNSYYLHWGSLKLMGSKETITRNSLVPLWNKNGKASAYDVDHIKELQLGGANFTDNMELLNFSANRASGSAVKNTIERQLNEFLTSEDAKKQATDKNKELPKTTAAKEKYNITFNNILYDDAKSNFSKGALGEDFWSKKDIAEDFDHLKNFTPMTAPQIAEAKGVKDDPVIYTSEAGGTGLRKKDLEALKGVTVTKFNFPEVPTGELAGNIELSIKPPSVVNGDIKVPIPIYKMEGVVFGGHMPRRGAKKGQGGLEKILSKLEINGLSPAVVDMAEIMPGIGLVVRGRIQPTLEIIKGFDLDFFIEGDNFGISKTITAGEIKVPPPFKINGAFLTIGAGNKGIFVEGDVFFEIRKLGTGKISGLGKSNGDFGIKGKFDFDPKLFRKSAASIEVEYNNKDGWSAKGELQIAKDSVKGIKSGNITVGYANNVLEANGTAELTIKGVKEVTLRIKFAEEVSEIEGGVKIEKLPGIKEGEGTLKLVKKGEEYDFSGNGKITPDIPGLSTQLAFEFHNDIFLVDAKVDFEKGRLKGTLNVGITNRAVDPEGKPTGEALPDYKVYGESTLALKITDNITVTAGVKLLENGEIEVRGGIKLPQRFQVVPKLFSIVNKPLISIPPIHIPLFGIPLGIATIGIEAVIKPRLTADVQIGPGDLTNVQAEIVYNPAHPDEMTIIGGADFEFIAEAGITAGVDFGISASIAIASLTGGINLSAYIKAAAQQPVFHANIKYSPKTGFELDGDVKALVKAILGFKGDLYAEASIGIWPADYTKRWEWPIFKKEIDTGLQIGFEFPFGYKDGKADVSFEKLKFSYPSLDDITSKVKEQIVNPIADKF